MQDTVSVAQGSSPAPSSPAARHRARTALLALAVFAGLAAVHTWPLATAPARLSRNDNGDTLLNTWAIAWVAHQLPRAPAHLFDANIFWPERRTLGYSEAMIVQGVLAMPVLALGGSPVLAYNLVLLAGFTFTGWAFWLLIQRWTGSTGAAYVAGSAAAFNSHVLVRLPHLQTQHVEFLALAFFALDRLVARRRLRDAVLLGVAFALEGLTSVYVMVFSSWAVLFAGLSYAGVWLRASGRRVAALLALSAVVAFLCLLPYLWAYYQIHREMGWERSLGETQSMAATWADYLSTGSRLYWPWSERFFEQRRSSTFPGVVVTVLAAAAVVNRGTRRNPRVRMAAAVVLGCLLVSAAPHLPGYAWLYRLPQFRAVRAQAHIGQMVLLALAILAGFGAAQIAGRWTARWPIVATGLVILISGEALRAPLVYHEFTGIPAIYDTLRREPGGAIVELPIPQTRNFALNAEYMLDSTRHWRPMVNGYSGFFPASYRTAYRALRGFPDDPSLAFLHDLRVTHVVVHTDRMQDRLKAIEAARTLRMLADDGIIRIYRLP